MKHAFFALVNPAAGGGRCGRLAGPALEKLGDEGLALDVVETRAAGHGIELARAAWQQGYRRFLAVGGDGTSYEILNGVMPEALAAGEKPTLAFLPLGTGNSFLRDFSDGGVEHATRALRAGRTRPCDVLRLVHEEGVLHYINLLSIGLAADVATVTNRRFKPLGPLGYLLGVLTCLVRLDRRAFPLRADDERALDRRPCLFLSFNNSKFTGGRMLIAPQADTADGLIEYVRWGSVGRLALLANLHRLYDGTHIGHAQAERRAVRRVEFVLDAPVDAMIDGEVQRLRPQRIDVLPGALNVMA